MIFKGTKDSSHFINNRGAAGKEFSCLEEVTMQYIISTLSLELKDIKDIDEETKQLYIECLHSWKRLSDDFSIEYLYE